MSFLSLVLAGRQQCIKGFPSQCPPYAPCDNGKYTPLSTIHQPPPTVPFIIQALTRPRHPRHLPHGLHNPRASPRTNPRIHAPPHRPRPRQRLKTLPHLPAQCRRDPQQRRPLPKLHRGNPLAIRRNPKLHRRPRPQHLLHQRAERRPRFPECALGAGFRDPRGE